MAAPCREFREGFVVAASEVHPAAPGVEVIDFPKQRSFLVMLQETQGPRLYAVGLFLILPIILVIALSNSVTYWVPWIIALGSALWVVRLYFMFRHLDSSHSTIEVDGDGVRIVLRSKHGTRAKELRVEGLDCIASVHAATNYELFGMARLAAVHPVLWVRRGAGEGGSRYREVVLWHADLASAGVSTPGVEFGEAARSALSRIAAAISRLRGTPCPLVLTGVHTQGSGVVSADGTGDVEAGGGGVGAGGGGGGGGGGGEGGMSATASSSKAPVSAKTATMYPGEVSAAHPPPESSPYEGASAAPAAAPPLSSTDKNPDEPKYDYGDIAL